MTRSLAMLVLPAFLLACGGSSNPFTPAPAVEDPPVIEDPDAVPDTPAGVPETLAGDLASFAYDADAQTLTVTGLNLDEVPVDATYRRRPALDINGYEAYTAQDDPLDRHVTAYVRQRGSVRAGVVASGGPRNRFFTGGYYERDGAFRPPNVTQNSGLVTYAGRYVGLTNVNGDGGDLAPVPAGTPDELRPDQAGEVRGRILFQADFADNTVEGNIINRRLADTGQRLPSVVLVVGQIDDAGEFFGNQVEYEASDFPGENVIGTDIGDYGGIFAGANASEVGGIVVLNQFDGPNDDLGFENEIEHGTFVLDRCTGGRRDDALCNGVN